MRVRPTARRQRTWTPRSASGTAASTPPRLARTHGEQIEAWGGFAHGKNNLFTDPVLTAIGSEHGKTVAQIVLRWLIQRDVVTIPKLARRGRMEQNLDVFDFALTDEDLSRIAAMDTGASRFFDHRDPAMVSWLNSRYGI